MKITALSPVTADLTAEQFEAATELAPRLWNHPGTRYRVDGFPGPSLNLPALRDVLQTFVRPALKVSVDATDDGAFTAIAEWRAGKREGAVYPPGVTA